MSQAADSDRPPLTMQRGDAVNAELKAYKYRSLTDWLLMRKLLQPVALVLCLLALAGGVALPLDQRDNSAAVVLVLLAVSTLLYIVVLQRHVFAIRFESGPLLLDLPRKLPALIFCALLFAPPFLFATAHHTRIALSGGAQLSQVAETLALFMNPSNEAEQATEAVPAEEAVEGGGDFHGGDVTAENLAAATQSFERNRAVYRQRINERLPRTREAVQRLYRRFGWPQTAEQQMLASIDAAAVKLRTQLDELSPPTIGQYFYNQSAGFQGCYENRDICVLADRLAYLSAVQTTLGVPRRDVRSFSDSGNVSRASPFAIMFSGACGLLLVLGLAFFCAMLLRISRLSLGSAPYLAAGAVVLLVAFVSSATVANALYRTDVELYPYLPGYGSWLLIAFVLSPFALGFVQPLRRDGWRGLITRVLAMAITLALLSIMAAWQANGLTSTYMTPGTEWIVWLPAPLFLLFIWPIWVLFDRAIIRGNCAPKRFG